MESRLVVHVACFVNRLLIPLHIQIHVLFNNPYFLSFKA